MKKKTNKNSMNSKQEIQQWNEQTIKNCSHNILNPVANVCLLRYIYFLWNKWIKQTNKL